jgi:hypothetical protein
VTPGPDWKIADVLDFEYLLADDSRRSDDLLRSRDQTLYATKILPEIGPERALDRRGILLSWVHWRRKEADQLLPGEAYAAGWQTLVTLSALVGLIMGGSLCAGLLHYSGDEPINALLFLGWTLGPQLLLLLFGVLLWIERHTTRFLQDWRPLRAVLGGLAYLLSAGLRRLPGEQRHRFSAVMGRFGPKRETYAPIATWSFLIVTQAFAVAFNLGIVGMLLAELPARELRFGWQTTLDIQSREAAKAVQAVALPWNWAPRAHPTAEQVFATRYAPGQKHAELPADAMRAWWPFLAYSVVVYGLLPRLVLLLLAAVRFRRNIGGLRFDHVDANALWRRLTGPLVTARGGEARLPELRSEEPPAPPRAQGGSSYALVAEELELDADRVRNALASHFGWRVVDTRKAKIDNRRESAELLANLRSSAPELASIVLVVPAVRDPIVAVALFLKEVVAAASAGKPETLVLLTGEPTGDGFQPVSESRLEIWRRFRDIQKLPIGIERWP